MEQADLLLPPDLRDEATAFFEQRAGDVDCGQCSVREGIAYVNQTLLHDAGDGKSPNADLTRVIEAVATVAWSDMSTAFSLWCQRMVLEYLAHAPAGSFLRTDLLPRIQRTELLGSTALASAMAHDLSGAPLTVSGAWEASGVSLTGRVTWASNLCPPDFIMVTAAAGADRGQAFIVALPGDAEGLSLNPYPRLLALQATYSTSAVLQDVRVEREWIVTDDFAGFIGRVRPPFLMVQSAMAWGLAARALHETAAVLGGVNESLRSDLDELNRTASRLAAWIRNAARDRGQTAPIRDVVQTRLDCVRLAVDAVALEAKATGGRGYVTTSATARRLREAAFLPIQAPTEGQLRWELSRYN